MVNFMSQLDRPWADQFKHYLQKNKISIISEYACVYCQIRLASESVDSMKEFTILKCG